MDNRRIITKLTSSSDKVLSGWQLQELISLMSSSYYKLDLIREVLDGLKLNKSFFIMDKSFEINNNYKTIRKNDIWSLYSKSNVESLYNLGKPIALIPDENVQNIYYVFKYYEKIYTLFGKYKIERIKKSNLRDLINSENGIEVLKEIIDKKIDNLKTEKIMKYELKEKTEKIYRDICKEIDNVKNDYATIRTIVENLNDKDFIDEYLNTGTNRNVERRYFQRFFTILKRFERPIIFSYDNCSGEIEIIKKQYICNDSENKSFLDVKQYSHNSPFEIIFIGGTILVPMILCAAYRFKKEKDKELNKELGKIIEGEETYFEEKENNYVYINFKQVYRNTKLRIEKMLNKYGLINDKIEIDFEKEKK